MPLTLLQYHVGSRTSKAEAVKQELVQTALHQGLCDIALVQGCSRTQDTVRAGAGAVFQSESSHAPLSSSLGVQRVCQPGVMLFYRAERFQAKQLALVADDLPGWTFLAVQLCDTSTGSNLIALTACTPSLAADAALAQSHEPAAALVTPLSHLMQRLSATCPVVAAGEVTALLGADTGLASLQQHMQICLCAPVQTATASSQAFFAALCTSPGQQVKLSNMQSILPTPLTAVSQYTQNAHTVDCWLPHDSPESSLAQNDTMLSHHSTLEPPGNNADCITRLAQGGSASVRLQNLIAAAEEVWQLP